MLDGSSYPRLSRSSEIGFFKMAVFLMKAFNETHNIKTLISELESQIDFNLRFSKPVGSG